MCQNLHKVKLVIHLKGVMSKVVLKDEATQQELWAGSPSGGHWGSSRDPRIACVWGHSFQKQTLAFSTPQEVSRCTKISKEGGKATRCAPGNLAVLPYHPPSSRNELELCQGTKP